MNIDLTKEQQLAVQNGETVRISVPEMGGDVVLLRADQYEAIREVLEDNRQQKGFREAGLKSALPWLKENPY